MQLYLLIFFIFNNYFMNFITKIVKGPMQMIVRAPFASDNWKDRDQSSEKVYISNEESNLQFI